MTLPAADYTWATFATLLLLAVLSYFSSKREQKKEAAQKQKDAEDKYREALESGTPEQIALANRRRKRLSKSLCLLLVAGLLALPGCASMKVIPVGDYVRTPVEGETVPALPSGERRWLLISVPTGTDLILEKD